MIKLLDILLENDGEDIDILVPRRMEGRLERMIKLKDILFEYFVVDGIPFLLLQNGHIVRVKGTHLDDVAELYDLTDDIKDRFESEFQEPFDYHNDSDMEYFNEHIKDFMFKNNIFPIVVDKNTKIVYIRPVLSKKPNAKQLKYVKDWAIEQGYDEDLEVDFAFI